MDSTGNPVANANVQADYNSVTLGATTGADGSFRLQLPNAGKVCFSLNYAVGNVGLTASTWTIKSGANCLDIGKKFYVFDVVVPAGTPVSGKVLDHGKPAAGVQVRAVPNVTGKGIENGAQTDSSGHFSMRLLPGTYGLSADTATGQPQGTVRVGSLPISGITLK